MQQSRIFISRSTLHRQMMANGAVDGVSFSIHKGETPPLGLVLDFMSQSTPVHPGPPADPQWGTEL